MTDVKTTGKPSLWNQALKVVKGDSTSELVEKFTQEMTLVAEGLCEDQARLRRAVDGLIQQAEKDQNRNVQGYEELDKRIDKQEKEIKERLNELSRRVTDLEKKAQKKSRRGLRALFTADGLGRLTLLVAIVCVTVVAVTALKTLI